MAKIEISEDVLNELINLANELKGMESASAVEKEVIETRVAKIKEKVEIPSDLSLSGEGCIACGLCISCGTTVVAVAWGAALAGLAG